MTSLHYIVLGLALLVVVVVGVALVVAHRGEPKPPRPRPGIGYAPGVGNDDAAPSGVQRPTVDEGVDTSVLGSKATVEEPSVAEMEAVWESERPEPAAGRFLRLRRRLARSQNSLGRGLLSLLSRDIVDQATWDEIEETLLTADLGVQATNELMERLHVRVRAEAPRDTEVARSLLRSELVDLLGPDLDRTLRVSRDSGPAVILVVGVNGTGKTTTTGKLGRLLVAEGRSVVLGAADTFRAAAAQQLQTWGDRVGAAVVRGPEGGDPAAVAFDAVGAGMAAGVDTVIIDTAGRLHTKVGLMDELGKVKRVIEKRGPVDEVLLVLDATTGQNGLTQARVFSEVVDVTGIVLTKLDGTAKGGIVVAVQRELAVPVKLVGLGEGPDDLAPFSAEEFVDALLADPA
ncbi:MAG: signal recognition particle-docking protein FtsY [Actinobacteria bacterium]|nr:signal recognition particle-docking protein FtsY [Actinomycetota bacterium]